MGAKVATFKQCYNAEKRRRLLYSRTPVAAAEPSAPNKAVSTATATFKIVFHLFIIVYLLSALLLVKDYDTEEFYVRTRSHNDRVGECKRWYSC